MTMRTIPLKVILRHLPPLMTEEEFLSTVEPLPPHNYLRFCNADSTLGQFGSARVYISFVNESALFEFKERFDGYVFVDSKGNESVGFVEYSIYQKVPPVISASDTSGSISVKSSSEKQRRVDPKKGTISQDPEYIAFVENLEKQRSGEAPVTEPGQPTWETYLEEIKAKEKEMDANHGVLKVMTPLLEFIQQKKAAQEQKRRDEERRRKEHEIRRRQMERERRERQAATAARRQKEKEKREEKEREKEKSTSSKTSAGAEGDGDKEEVTKSGAGKTDSTAGVGEEKSSRKRGGARGGVSAQRDKRDPPGKPSRGGRGRNRDNEEWDEEDTHRGESVYVPRGRGPWKPRSGSRGGRRYDDYDPGEEAWEGREWGSRRGAHYEEEERPRRGHRPEPYGRQRKLAEEKDYDARPPSSSGPRGRGSRQERITWDREYYTGRDDEDWEKEERSYGRQERDRDEYGRRDDWDYGGRRDREWENDYSGGRGGRSGRRGGRPPRYSAGRRGK